MVPSSNWGLSMGIHVEPTRHSELRREVSRAIGVPGFVAVET